MTPASFVFVATLLSCVSFYTGAGAAAAASSSSSSSAAKPAAFAAGTSKALKLQSNSLIGKKQKLTRDMLAQGKCKICKQTVHQVGHYWYNHTHTRIARAHERLDRMVAVPHLSVVLFLCVPPVPQPKLRLQEGHLRDVRQKGTGHKVLQTNDGVSTTV